MGTLLLPAKSHSPPAKVVFQISCNKEVARLSPAPPRAGDEARRVNVGRQSLGAPGRRDRKGREPRFPCSSRGRARCHGNGIRRVEPFLLPVNLIRHSIWGHVSRAVTAPKYVTGAGVPQPGRASICQANKARERTWKEQNGGAAVSPLPVHPP